MDIGTAKPSRAEQAQVQHRMIDLVEPSEVYTAGRYRSEATRLLQRLGAEGKAAFVSGGTGFYIRALLSGLSLPHVDPDPDLRLRLREEARARGPEALWSRLRVVDPDSASRIHPRNLPRTIRALEVVQTLGGPVPRGGTGSKRDALYIGLSMDRPRLHRVADARVVKQVSSGLVEETRLLLDMGYDPESPALSGFGYREMIAYLGGRLSLEDAVTAYQIATHRYIRRQMTWFRREPDIVWFDVDQQAEEAIHQRVETWMRSTLTS
jgi:tRNA dimethylallyltransferase